MMLALVLAGAMCLFVASVSLILMWETRGRPVALLFMAVASLAASAFVLVVSRMGG